MKALIIFFISILLWYLFKDNYINNEFEKFVSIETNKNISSSSTNKDLLLNTCYPSVMTPEEDKILEELIDNWNKISKELDIKWSVCGGSYIGTIRHSGRIPWDDDFDIIIMNEDVNKLENIDKEILKPYNISISRFWGGFKMYYNDHRGLKKFERYGWNWPFIDIFAYDKGKDCSFLKKEELPLIKTKFGNTHVFIPENISKSRGIIDNQEWKNTIFDDGFRHQFEMYGKKDCPKKKFN